ncbi:hypothetical protein [Carnobacterium maltaromaticum]|uniref:hypothetical protein n=1 Tax=Carnobacterium maltaromaticum TaxID=2751 RepID=UPI0010720AEB|nr:hypothetical protein [Carnobacterium maltaromaticum]TFJ73580.1 hypothetical protein CKN94_10340 [Carnobacterium maltaromaticum]TFJ77882.1 hypothetical protein CKN97_10735 [Carnobacterium maltaromaticum]
MLDDVLKDLKKRAQKSMIRGGVSRSLSSKKDNNYQKIKKSGDRECSSVKEKLNTVSETFSITIKGQFGKEIKETFKKQTEKLTKL